MAINPAQVARNIIFGFNRAQSMGTPLNQSNLEAIYVNNGLTPEEARIAHQQAYQLASLRGRAPTEDELVQFLEQSGFVNRVNTIVAGNPPANTGTPALPTGAVNPANPVRPAGTNPPVVTPTAGTPSTDTLYSGTGNQFLEGLRVGDPLAAWHRDPTGFSNLANLLLNNYQTRASQTFNPIARNKFEDVAERIGALIDLEHMLGETANVPDELANYFKDLLGASATSYDLGGSVRAPGQQRGAGLLNRVLSTSEGAPTSELKNLLADTNQNQTRDYVFKALAADMAPHLRRGLGRRVSDAYTQYENVAPGADAAGQNFFRFAKNLGLY